ncbi:MAG: hypothetical protein ACRDOO_22450, partial [Actinomadura sp.]
MPIGDDGDRWSTRQDTRKILVVAHTVTSLTRLLDVLAILEGDLRTHVLFTVIPASAFDDGVPAFLADIGAKTIPWEQAIRNRF